MTLFDTKTFQLDIGDLKYKGSVYGNGTRHIFYFHGFGQDSQSVKKFLSNVLLKEFTVHSIGLFYHESLFPDERLPGNPYDRDELTEFIENYSIKNSIESFYLMGYSIGARICFELLSNRRSQGIFVLAADGITRNIWHTLFSRSGILERIAFGLVKRSKLSYIFIGMMYKMGFISSYEKQLIEFNITTPSSLKKVFNTWTCYSKIYPEMKSWMKIIEDNNIPHFFLFGRNDKIISSSAYKKMMMRSDNVMVVDDGHNLVKEKYSKVVNNFFLS